MNPIGVGECIQIGLFVDPSATHLAEASTFPVGKKNVAKDCTEALKEAVVKIRNTKVVQYGKLWIFCIRQ